MYSLVRHSQLWMHPLRQLLFTGSRFPIRQYCQEKVNGTDAPTCSRTGSDIDNADDDVPGTSASAVSGNFWQGGGYKKEDESTKHTKISASAQLAQVVFSETKLEAPEPIQRMVELENVRSKINELDQRKLRHQEYVQMLKQLIVKPSTSQTEPRLPFKQPAPANDLRASLRNCTCSKEVLQLTNDPEQLANELVRLAWELNTEKRKSVIVLESYLELKQEKMHTKSKSN